MHKKVVTRLAFPLPVKFNYHTNEKARRSKALLYFYFIHVIFLCARRRQPGWDVPAPSRRRGDDGEQAPGGRHELCRLEVVHGGGSAGGQPGHGCTPTRPEQWVVTGGPVLGFIVGR